MPSAILSGTTDQERGDSLTVVTFACLNRSTISAPYAAIDRVRAENGALAGMAPLYSGVRPVRIRKIKKAALTGGLSNFTFQIRRLFGCGDPQHPMAAIG